MKLLTELNEDVEFIKESVDGKKNYYLKGVYLQSEIENKNGRFYPQAVMEKEVARYIKENIQAKKSYGELNHPTNPSINLDKVSHLITELKRDGKNYIGTAKILTSTPNGKIVAALMDEGCRLGVSSRGLGSIKQKGNRKIVESLHLTTAADIVADPSAPDAIPDHIIENIDWFFDGADWVKREKVYDLVENHKRLKKEAREEQFLTLFKRLLDV